MADLTHNGKSQFMEPLSSGIRLPEILLDRQSREPLNEQITRQLQSQKTLVALASSIAAGTSPGVAHTSRDPV